MFAHGLLAFLVLLGAGCASRPRFVLSSRQPAASASDPALLTVQKTNAVSVRVLTRTYANRLEEAPKFDVTVANQGDTTLIFAPTDVVVYSGTKAVRIFSAAELVEKIQKDSEREAEEAAAQDAVHRLSEGGTRVDPTVAPVLVNRTASINRASEASDMAAKKLAAMANAIVPMSVSPGKTGSGVIQLHAEDIDATAPLRIVVTIGGDAYEFVFNVSPETS